MSAREVAARFWAKVDRGEGCWTWRGAENGRGYGRFSVDGRLVYVDHLCRNPSCVRPAHLEPVSKGENTSRGTSGFKLAGTCRSGRHDVTDPSAIYTQAGGTRCRVCATEGQQRRRAS